MPNGYVYVLSGNGVCKIGKTVMLKKRLYDYSILPFKTELVHVIESDDPRRLERYIHGMFADKRVRGEWFNLDQSDIDKLKAVCKVNYDKPLSLAGAVVRGTLAQLPDYGLRLESWVQNGIRYWQWCTKTAPRKRFYIGRLHSK